MRRDAAEQRARLRRPPSAREHGRGHRGRQRRSGRAAPDAAARARTAGTGRRSATRTTLTGRRRPAASARRPPPARARWPRPTGTSSPAAAVVERVGAVDLGPAPLEPVALELERIEERRADRHRVHGGADVVHQAGNGQPRRSARRRRSSSSASRTVTSTPSRASATAHASPFGPGADDDRAAHATAAGPGCRSLRMTSTGQLERLLEPRPALDHLGHVDPALLDQAGRRVVDAVVLAAGRARAATRASRPAAHPARSGTAP